MNNKAEHAFIRIEKDMKSGNIPGLVLLYGIEDYLVDHYRQILSVRFTDPATRQMDLSIFDPDHIDLDSLIETAETLPLASEKKVVLLSGFIDSRGKMPGTFERDQSLRNSFYEWIEHLPDDAFLLISAEKPYKIDDYKRYGESRRLKELIQKVEKAGGSAYGFGSLDRDQLRGFVTKRFKSAGKTCNRAVMQAILYETGYGSRYTEYDLYTLENDLKKIIASSGDKPEIDENDLVGTLTISPENNIFHMLEAMSKGRTDQALIDLNTLLVGGEPELRIHSNLVRQIELMLISRELQDENKSRPQIIEYLVKTENVNKFRAEKVVNTASRSRTDDLKDMLSKAIAIEEHIKGGLMSGRLALEFFIGCR